MDRNKQRELLEGIINKTADDFIYPVTPVSWNDYVKDVSQAILDSGFRKLEEKRCKSCQKNKPLSEFRQFKSGKNEGYYHPYCTPCSKIIRHDYYSLPWIRTYQSINNRLIDKKNKFYYNSNLKNLLTPDQLKTIWFRDNAHRMKKPTIDRIDNKGDYTFENCRYIELSENCCKEKRMPVWQIKGKFKKLWDSQAAACRHIGIAESIMSRAINGGKLINGYKWIRAAIAKGDEEE